MELQAKNKVSKNLKNYLNQIKKEITTSITKSDVGFFRIQTEIDYLIHDDYRATSLLIDYLIKYLDEALASKYITEINRTNKKSDLTIIDDTPKNKDRTEKVIPSYSIHPSAELIPMMTDEEFQRLKANISERGQDDPIIIYNDKIIDGRHRYRACIELEIQPKIIKVSNKDNFVDLVISKNMHRRELTSSQRAAIGVNLLPEYEKRARERQKTSSGGSNPQLREKIPKAEPYGRASETVAKIVGSNRKYIEFLWNIKEEYPDLFDQVFNGRKTISQIKKLIESKEIKTGKAITPQLSGIPETILIDIFELYNPPIDKLQSWSEICVGKGKKFFNEYINSKDQKAA